MKRVIALALVLALGACAAPRARKVGGYEPTSLAREPLSWLGDERPVASLLGWIGVMPTASLGWLLGGGPFGAGAHGFFIGTLAALPWAMPLAFVGFVVDEGVHAACPEEEKAPPPAKPGA